MTATETQAEYSARMAAGYAERDARWAASRHRELTTDQLMLRDSNARRDADDLDAAFDSDDAAKAVAAVDAAWGEPDEDACDADPDRFELYVTALEAAVNDTAADYRDSAEQAPWWVKQAWRREGRQQAELESSGL